MILNQEMPIRWCESSLAAAVYSLLQQRHNFSSTNNNIMYGWWWWIYCFSVFQIHFKCKLSARPPLHMNMARQQQLRVILLLLLFPLYADRSWHLHSTKVLCTTIFFGRNLFTVATTIQSGELRWLDGWICATAGGEVGHHQRHTIILVMHIV